uniref:Uncharacterized protein n=1 Tax=Ananas comosus var. bracteatus TaxID=296719 RepID=A0A6V7QEM3_ANACO|nr:unnamed protein product [Ananas comosus var. bracteatus]
MGEEAGELDKRIKEWCTTEFYNIRDGKSKLMGKILKIDKEEEQCDFIREDLMKIELKEKLSRVLQDEESLWRTRAKQHCSREGDENTKFFHTTANGKRKANGIGPIDEYGAVHRAEEDKKNYFLS